MLRHRRTARRRISWPAKHAFLVAFLLPFSLLPDATWGGAKSGAYLGDDEGRCEEPVAHKRDGPAALPRRTPEVGLLRSESWKTYTVGIARDFSTLQHAYDRAVEAGENIRIQVTARYDAGALVLRDRRGASHWIYIEPLRKDGLPPAGVRATKDDASAMYKIRGPLEGRIFREAVRAEANAGYTRIIGADISVPDDRRRREHSHLVRIRGDAGGSDPKRISETPQHVILDRCYVHLPTDGSRFAAYLIGLYGRHLSVVHSYIVGGGRGYEATKAINSGYAPGPLLIENNYLATDGINIFFGGNVRAHNDWIPSDITIRRNHIHKPLRWYGNRSLGVKNGFEIKNARRVLVEGNVFQNNWQDAQAGRMILLRAESPGGVCEDITFRYNRILNTPAVWDLVGMDGRAALRPMRRISIHDNVASRIGAKADFSGTREALRILTTSEAPIRDLWFVHNTHADLGGEGLALNGGSSNHGINCVLRDNIFDRGRYGIKRDSVVEGARSLDSIFGPDNYVWSHNVGSGFPAKFYPAESNDYPTLVELKAHFVDPENGNLRLVPESPYHAGGHRPPFDGAMRGADVEKVDCYTEAAVGSITGD